MSEIGHNSVYLADDESVYMPADALAHPITGLARKDYKREPYTNFEAWLAIMFKARWVPGERSFKDKTIRIDRGELLISRKWLASKCHWTERYAAQFLKSIDDGELSQSRPMFDGAAVHGATPFVLRVLDFKTASLPDVAPPSQADGNIKMYVSSTRGPKPKGVVPSEIYPRDAIPQETRRAVYERDGYKCLKCGSDKYLSLDHIIAVTSGGDNSEDNLRTLCLDCNIAKGPRNGEDA